MTPPNKQLNALHLLGVFGSNKVMAGEFSRLVRRAFSAERSREVLATPPRKAGPGGIVVDFAPDVAALCLGYHRTCARVLWDLAESYATRLEPLYDDLLAALRVDERPWWRPARISVLAFGTDCIQAGQRQIVGVVKNALVEAARERGIQFSIDPDDPELTFHARCLPDATGEMRLVLSLDLAGGPMHRRGYRMMSGEAPLREDLAANLVMLSRFDPRREVFIDPLAGSGTLAIEAALMGAGKSIWMSGRRPAASAIEPLSDLLAQKQKPLFGDCQPRIFAAEIDPDTYGALDQALHTAGTSAQTTSFLGDFRDWDLAGQLRDQEHGLILSNPPYGARLDGGANGLGRLYRDLGQWCREFRGYRAAFIVGEPKDEDRSGPPVARLFQDCFGGKPRVRKPLSNGPLRAQFLMYDL